MKLIVFALLTLLAIESFGQSWYSKLLDPFTGKQEAATIMEILGDTVFIRARANCGVGSRLCSEVGRFSIKQNQIIDFKHYDKIQAGGKNLLINSDKLILASEEIIKQENISISQVNKLNLDYINTLELKVQNSRYFSYTIKNSIVHFDHLIIGAQALDSLTFVGLSGWNNYQENALFFVLDSALQVDTTLIIPPTSGAFLKIEDMVLGPDSVLYVSFFEKYLKHGPSFDYLEIHKIIYGFDKKYNIIFQWTGPDFDRQESLSCIAVGLDTTIYLNYRHDAHDYILALKKDGSTKWECLLNPIIGVNIHNIRNLVIAKNGDIIGSGVLTSLVDDLGESGFIFRVDPQGNLKWKKAIRVNKGFDLTIPETFPYQTGLEDIAELPNNDLLAVGYVRKFVGFDQPDGPYNFDIWIVRISEDGCLYDNCPLIQDVVIKDNYVPIVYSGNEWVVEAISPNLPTTLNRYSFSEDSVLYSGKYYHKLIFKTTIQGPWQETGRIMREDNGRVFEFSYTDSSELLLYNLNFQIGDTLSSHADGSINHRKVINVGSIKLSDEIPRKLITIECTSNLSDPDTTIWIEGIGDAERLFWTKTFCSSLDSDDSIAAVRCFLTNDLWMYSRPGLVDDCYITSVDHIAPEVLSIYPNPNLGLLHFNIDPDQIVSRINIYNDLGILVLSSVDFDTNYTIDISNQPSGIYTGLIYFNNSSVKLFKTIVVK